MKWSSIFFIRIQGNRLTFSGGKNRKLSVFLIRKTGSVLFRKVPCYISANGAGALHQAETDPLWCLATICTLRSPADKAALADGGVGLQSRE